MANKFSDDLRDRIHRDIHDSVKTGAEIREGGAAGAKAVSFGAHSWFWAEVALLLDTWALFP